MKRAFCCFLLSFVFFQGIGETCWSYLQEKQGVHVYWSFKENLQKGWDVSFKFENINTHAVQVSYKKIEIELENGESLSLDEKYFFLSAKEGSTVYDFALTKKPKTALLDQFQVVVSVEV